jgi:hypothetical protein
LPLNKLRLITGGGFDKYADMSHRTFGFAASRFRFYELLLNCATVQNKTVIRDVNLELVMAFA